MLGKLIIIPANFSAKKESISVDNLKTFVKILSLLTIQKYMYVGGTVYIYEYNRVSPSVWVTWLNGLKPEPPFSLPLGWVEDRRERTSRPPVQPPLYHYCRTPSKGGRRRRGGVYTHAPLGITPLGPFQ